MPLIVTKTPFRVSFVGGGSDLPSFYRHHKGAVVSASINQFMYVSVKGSFESEYILHYSKTERTNDLENIEHPLIKNTLKELGFKVPLQVSSLADIPASGTGLGSSSSFTVGLTHALKCMMEQRVSKKELAEIACKVEIDRCGEPIGKQDQYAAALGGFNVYEFNKDETVKITPVNITAQVSKTFQNKLQFFYTNKSRSTSSILSQQNENMKMADKTALMRRMVKLVGEFKQAIERSDFDVIGQILHENWMLKKQMSDDISDHEMDAAYESTIAAGATGGKLLGAGGGGFFMTYADPQNHRKIRQALSKYKECKFSFSYSGSEVFKI